MISASGAITGSRRRISRSAMQRRATTSAPVRLKPGSGKRPQCGEGPAFEGGDQGASAPVTTPCPPRPWMRIGHAPSCGFDRPIVLRAGASQAWPASIARRPVAAITHRIVYAASAYVLWGLFPLYFIPRHSAVPKVQFSHRRSLLFVLALLAWRRRWGWLGAALRQPRVLARLRGEPRCCCRAAG